MRRFVLPCLIFFSRTSCMDTNSQTEQLSKKLRNIVLNGNWQSFEDNQTAFAKGLGYHDIHDAHWQCEHRLSAIEEHNIICTDMRMDILVTLMQKEIKKNHLSMYDFKEHIKEKYKLDDPTDQEALTTAAKIAETLTWHSIHFLGPHIMHLKKKITRQKRPAQFLETEKQNTTQLRDGLQAILDSEFEPRGEPEYNKERNLYSWKDPQRKQK